MTFFGGQIFMDDLKLKFGGGDSIDANTLISNLIHFTNITQEVNKELHTDRSIEVKITPFKEGSFIVHILLQSSVIDAVGNIFTRENIQVAGEIATAVGGLFALTKFLGGKKPKVSGSVTNNDNSIRVENNEGAVTIVDKRVFKIYQDNSVVKESISQEFASLQNDTNVTDFEILDKNDAPIVQFAREEFSEIADVQDNSEIKPNERFVTRTAVLSIYTLSFDRNIKWTFIFEGNKVTAKISDDFALRIDNGEQFAKGDALEAEIEIRQEFTESANAWINKSYKINKIINHIPRAAQQKIDFPKS